MDHIWNNYLKELSNKDKLKELRIMRKGMSWGSQEHGMPQLSETVIFLLRVIDDLEEKKK